MPSQEGFVRSEASRIDSNDGLAGSLEPNQQWTGNGPPTAENDARDASEEVVPNPDYQGSEQGRNSPDLEEDIEILDPSELNTFKWKAFTNVQSMAHKHSTFFSAEKCEEAW
ncbi:hypothetical protein CYLTODRAFT_199451, partial [Cylindrobasidium torrendii FP15055 ss-10]